jgi:hypothetical protein
LALALFPVMVIWISYSINQYFFSGLPWLELDDPVLIKGLVGTGILIIMIYWLQIYLSIRRLKPLITEPSLGLRIKKYIPVVLIRFRSFSLMLLVIGLGIFLTAKITFLYLLPIPLLSFIIYWPSRWRIAKDLKLKAEEKEILGNKTLGV